MVWQGVRVISPEWWQTSTTRKVDPPDHPRLGYGYYWWIVPEADGFTAWGHGGQYAFVIPSRRLVLVLVSLPDTDGNILHGGKPEHFIDLTRPLWQP